MPMDVFLLKRLEFLSTHAHLTASWTIWLLALVVLLAVYLVLKSFTSRSVQYPPGPSRDPIIGNLRQVPIEDPYKAFTEMSHVYGDVVYLNVLGKEIIVLNSVLAARDLLEKKGSNYSDRPRFVALGELMGWTAVVSNMRYGPRFQKHRKMINSKFSLQAMSAYMVLQEQETNILLQGLMNTPEEFVTCITRFTSGILMNVTYGHRVTSPDDLFVYLADEAVRLTIESGNPGSSLVDFIPALKYIPTWFPGAGFKRQALIIHGEVRKMLEVPYNQVRQQMKSGEARQSLVADLIQTYEDNGVRDLSHEEDIRGVAGVLYSAGGDTTKASLTTFILLMVQYPEVFAKAQAEMDHVIGRDRLPDLSDRSSLPYLQSVMWEALRWHPPGPLSLPHMSMEDDIYRGWHMPGQAMIIPNLWAMSRDPSWYPHPNEFNPDRFMGLSSDDLDRIDPRKWVFGFGRRICPGMHFAELNVWLALAKIIATLDISKAIDANGHTITPPAEFSGTFIQHPEPFKCSIKPRSEKATSLIRNAEIE